MLRALRHFGAIVFFFVPQAFLGEILATYLHGLFESPAVLQALFGRAPRSLDAVFDGLAEVVDTAFEPGVLWSLLDTPIASPLPDTA